jgi:uncharacterized protein (TIGR02466 family)
MNIIETFPISVGHINSVGISNSLIEEYKDYINTLPFNESPISNFTLEQQLLDNPLFKDLKKIIIQNSKNYLDTLGFIDINLEIINSWATRTYPTQYSHSHIHRNSYISGIYYLTEGSRLEFYDPTRFNWFVDIPKRGDSTTQSNFDTTWVQPLPDVLLLFPSFLEHQITPHTENTTRMSIAFNIVPRGTVGYNTSYLKM